MALPTTGTGFGRWHETTDLHNRLPALQRHPLQDCKKTGKAKIAHFASPYRFHALQVQVLEVQDCILVAQAMCQLKVMVTPLISNVRAVFCQRPSRPFAAMRSFHLTGQLAVKFTRLTKIVSEELRAGTGTSFIVREKRFESEVETAAFTRAGFGDTHGFLNAEDHP